MKRSLISLFGVLVVAATTALAQSHGSRHAPCPAHRSTQRATEHSATTNTPFDRLMGDAMSAMHAGMQNAPHTGDPDRDFVTMMASVKGGMIGTRWLLRLASRVSALLDDPDDMVLYARVTP